MQWKNILIVQGNHNFPDHKLQATELFSSTAQCSFQGKGVSFSDNMLIKTTELTQYFNISLL